MGNEIIWSDDTSPQQIKEAFESGDRAAVGLLLDSLCADLDNTGRRISSSVAKKVLALLRQYVWFEKLYQMAEKFEEYAQNDPQVLRQLAQARIELKQITKAINGLLSLQQQLEKDLEKSNLDPTRKKTLEFEFGETMGLLGRCYKQLYVNADPTRNEPREYDVNRSLEYYGEAYEKRLGDFRWHGINRVALLTRKHRVTNHQKYSPQAKEVARNILAALEDLESRGPLQPWDIANQIEANLAIGDTVSAVKATQSYLECPGIDAFNVQSTRRQLLEVWQLNIGDPPGIQILPMMNARLAELGGGAKSIELNPELASTYEKVWGKTKYRPLQWIQQALDRSKCVARIGPNKYDGDGTGFLIDGAWVGDDLAGKPLLITNAHVCSDDPAVQAQYPYPSAAQDLTAAFLGSGGASDAHEIQFEKLIWSSQPSELDATLLLLESVPDGCKPPPITGRTPPATTKGDARLNILGHPKGLDMRISLQDNKTVSVGDKYIHYQTPTDPGSSGSPVFNQKWELVALHHAASSDKKANEGIRIDVILDAIKATI